MRENIEDTTSRRSVLKQGITLAGTSGIAVTTVSGQRDSEFHLGNKNFIQVNLRYDVPSSVPVGHASTQAKYRINSIGNQAGLIDGREADRIKGLDSVISADGGFHSGSDVIFGSSTKHLPLRDDYIKSGSQVGIVESDITTPSLQISHTTNGSIEATVGNRTKTVRTMDEAEISLPEQEVEILSESDSSDRDVRTVNVNPVVSIKNNGGVNFYGKRGYSVIPYESNDEYYKLFKSGYEGRLPTSMIDNNQGMLLVVEKGGVQ